MYVVKYLLILFFWGGNFEAKAANSSCDKVKSENESIKNFNKTSIYSFLYQQFGTETNCVKYKLNDTDLFSRIEIDFSKNAQLRFSNRFNEKGLLSWIHVDFKKNNFDNNIFLLDVVQHFNRMGFTIDWNNYFVVNNTNEKIHIYCDQLYKSGLLTIAHYSNDKLVKFKFGAFNRAICPKNYKDLEKLYSEIE